MPDKRASTSRTLRGRTVAITGAARGIGYATAEELRRRGANVVIGDIDSDAAIAAADRLSATGAHVDVSEEDSFTQFIATAEATYGPIDVLINNAGIMPIGPFLELPASLHRRAVEINVLGCINGTRAALPGMLVRGHGHVINVASTAGKAPIPGGASYCATKAAVLALTETVRVEYAGRGVQFTAVMPNFTNTELIAGTRGMKFVRTVEPRDVAHAIAAAIVRPRPDVYVPKMVGPMLRMQPLLGRGIRDYLNRKLGAYDAFLDADPSARAGYDTRIAEN